MRPSRQPALFISHGGGPWPYIDEMKKAFAKTAKELSEIPQQLPERPKAVLVVSGHWEEPEFTVGTAQLPSMVFDYSGFPEHTYRISYPAPGSPELAARVRSLLGDSGIKCQEDSERGFDHGIFVPLYLMYPNADVPIVSLSLKSSYDPAEHIRMGEALRPLRDEGVLIIGSGLSYHNMRGFRSGDGLEVSETFESWLNQTISESNVSRRTERLVQWEKAPAARLAHPQEDHLLPLMVVAGAAGEAPGHRIFLDHVMGVAMASYRFDG
jgi:aromatic ring-opening dioxygenase catalytic subunit (LigB family)